MRRKNYIKKSTILFGKNNFFFFRKNLIRKNLINFIFFKNLKLVKRKNIFSNYFFYNFFINFYKKNNLKIFFKNFHTYNNIFFNKNIIKKYFFFDVSKSESINYNNKLKFIFLRKNFNLFYYFNNSYLVNKNNLKFDLLDNLILINLPNNPLKIEPNLNFYIFFLNYNLFLFKLLEFYKILIILFIIKL